ncbi:hypothetical protein DERP_007703 [Dermatophagoides pteronyssinus]|uniref:Uncharacterized protein n=1 Tax=Dermatophagoides pteronyssinus TaxID=6956 RepID=A0ABQ8JKH2_DERPT|nr:hypothetical protein DERP_007703 [Dermatophagoides pteronyssinus]
MIALRAEVRISKLTIHGAENVRYDPVTNERDRSSQKGVLHSDCTQSVQIAIPCCWVTVIARISIVDADELPVMYESSGNFVSCSNKFFDNGELHFDRPRHKLVRQISVQILISQFLPA